MEPGQAGRGIAAAGLALLLAGAPLVGQTGAQPSRWGTPEPDPPIPIPVAPMAPLSDSWLPPLSSAVLPGSGQLLQRRRRGWVYLALEALVWTGFVTERRRGRDDRRAYRDLAWTVARVPAGPRVDGNFEYYERMSYWTRSGAFDRDPATDGLQPEVDRSTFNGDAWRLAVSIFLGDGPVDPGAPGYGQALAYYRERAYGDGFLWDWTGEADQMARFESLIEDSDSHFRHASLILGGALVNRFASSLDAILTRRAGRPASLRVMPARAGGHTLRQTFTFRVVLP